VRTPADAVHVDDGFVGVGLEKLTLDVAIPVPDLEKCPDGLH
jgi:hypothetical protein